MTPGDEPGKKAYWFRVNTGGDGKQEVLAVPTGNTSERYDVPYDEVEVIKTDGRVDLVGELYNIEPNANKYSMRAFYQAGDEYPDGTPCYTFDDSSDELLVKPEEYSTYEFFNPTGRTTVHEGVEYKEFKKRAYTFIDAETGEHKIEELGEEAETLWIVSDSGIPFGASVSPLNADFQPIETGDYHLYANNA